MPHGEWKPKASGFSESPPPMSEQLREAVLRIKELEADLANAADETERLRADLTTIAKHWPGKWTYYCVECDDEPWPCQIVLDVVVPWMPDEPDPDGEADDA